MLTELLMLSLIDTELLKLSLIDAELLRLIEWLAEFEALALIIPDSGKEAKL